MLLVIFGAGASYDSVNPRYWEGQRNTNSRPPLARELFEHRPSTFGKWVSRYPQGAAVIAELRRRSDTENVEDVLRYLQDEADTFKDPQLFSSLLAVRYYLQGVLYDCGNEWPESSNGLTNYVELAGFLSRWRHQKEERIAFATFNYDTLLDRAIALFPGSPLGHYVEGSYQRLFKLHGSVSWGRVVEDEPTRYAGGGGGVGGLMIVKATQIHVSEQFAPFPQPSTDILDGKPLVPAIAIPMTGKDSFEMPAAHLAAFREWLPDVDRVLVVGWRGQDPDLLALLKEQVSHPLTVLIVSTLTGIGQTQSALQSTGLSMSFQHLSTGFSGLIDDLAPLREFLG